MELMSSLDDAWIVMFSAASTIPLFPIKAWVFFEITPTSAPAPMPP